MNLREFYSSLPEPHRTEMLSRMQYTWELNARPNQIANTFSTFQVIVGGRGAGKTRAGAEWIREKAKIPNLRLLLVARTAADVRSTMVEGESGILNVSPPSERPIYKPATRRLEWANGTSAFCTSADEPDSLRGVQAHATWFDEPHGKEHPHGGINAFNNVCIATRLGSLPQILLTGTSQSHSDPLWQELKVAYDTHSVFRGETIHFRRNSTADNEANLHPKYLDSLANNYLGTAMATRELEGNL